MPEYLVELRGECREVYTVTADTEEEARSMWYCGTLYVSEADGMEVVSVKLDE
jgi:hypothetical protein